ncbi:MAG: aspartyl/asparaginyl beta-hydroxylase domain-containing protein [Paraglaciecola sp.]|uniref:aspartyl/asparaginyl beta-hydroxylase domain-containing protein n=1 Tax=Paraglaciecola sp. TaxID=1920173 RepID=UPI00329A1F36
MKLEHEFIQLPICFDVKRLKQEVRSLDLQLWVAHHEGFKGNCSIPLVSRGGLMNNDFKGPMATTPILRECSYLSQVIASFGEVVGRSRLMGLEAGCEVPLHSDINYHWYKRVRIHIPIMTEPSVVFHCGERQLHMKAGDAWIFDSWKYHKVRNDSDVFRVHLVIDICGSADFWKMANKGTVPWIVEQNCASQPKLIPYIPAGPATIKTEKFNTPLVMSPGEMEGLADDLIQDVLSVSNNKIDYVNEFVNKIRAFCQQWRCYWSLYSFTEDGWPHYHALRKEAFESVQHLDAKLKLRNGTQAPRMFLHCKIDPALNIEVKDSYLPIEGNVGSVQKTTVKSLSKESLRHHESIKNIGRNEPCHCGSGLKFKACHGKLS